MHKGGAGAGPAPIGDYLVKMLDSLAHRGTDSTGVTVAGQPKDQDLILRLRIESEQSEALLVRVRQVISGVGGEVVSHKWVDDYLRLAVQYGGRDEALPYHALPLRSGVRIGGRAERIADALVGLEGVEVHSIGECSEVIKDVGTASDLEERHKVGHLSGSHGIGHVRMATESRVDITHSHPFWANPYPDVTVVHNGQLTNYHKLKRAYEDQGYEFQTENDSELIAVYLADALSKGATLEEGPEAIAAGLGWHLHLPDFHQGWLGLCQGPVGRQAAGDHGDGRVRGHCLGGGGPAQCVPGRAGVD